MKKVFTSILILTNLISFGQNYAVDELWKLYNSRDLKSVIEKVKPLLENEPNNLDFNSILGRSFTDLGNYKEAIPYLDFTVKNDKNNSWQKSMGARISRNLLLYDAKV